jgi:hypothetical protein
MRVQYPHLVWGAIASSGEHAIPVTAKRIPTDTVLAVTHAQVDFPEYNDAIIKYAPVDCIDTLMSAISAIDHMLDMPEPMPKMLKGVFGLSDLKDHADFGEVLSAPLGGYNDGSSPDPQVHGKGRTGIPKVRQSDKDQ